MHVSKLGRDFIAIEPMSQLPRIIVLLLFNHAFASVARQILRNRTLKINRLLLQKDEAENALRQYDIGNRVVVDPSRLDPQALLFRFKPELLVEYAKICSRVSRTGQGTVPRMELHEQVPILEQVYQNEFEFKRGINQISGYLLATRSRGKTKFVASFAGTSSKIDIAHVSLLAETFLHDVPTHGGISFLVYQNTNDLHQFIEKERNANHDVELVLTGHSLGGAISLLAIFDLKKRWAEDHHVRIRCLNFAGPSPFKMNYVETILETVGYNNILNVYRRADPIYQAADAVGMIGIGPSLYLQDKMLANPENLPIVKRVKENFGHNHYIGGYIKDLEDSKNSEIWEYLKNLKKLVEINKKLKFYQILTE